MIATPEPFVFSIEHHVMIMVSMIKGADLRTLQNISTYNITLVDGMLTALYFRPDLARLKNQIEPSEVPKKKI